MQTTWNHLRLPFLVKINFYCVKSEIQGSPCFQRLDHFFIVNSVFLLHISLNKVIHSTLLCQCYALLLRHNSKQSKCKYNSLFANVYIPPEILWLIYQKWQLCGTGPYSMNKDNRWITDKTNQQCTATLPFNLQIAVKYNCWFTDDKYVIFDTQ